VPVAATRQPEVGAADPQPTEAGGVGEHLVQQLAVGPLEVVALDQGPTGVGDPVGERVADLLELTQVEQARRTRGGDPVWDDDPPQTLGDQATELPLELGDLPAQLGAGKTLVDRDSVEHSPHRGILSRLEDRGGNP
jgi:hypothetical protein